MSIQIAVQVTPDCEELLARLPRGYEYELTQESYNDDGAGVIVFVIHGENDLTAAQEQALDTNPGVVGYTVKPLH